MESTGEDVWLEPSDDTRHGGRLPGPGSGGRGGRWPPASNTLRLTALRKRGREDNSVDMSEKRLREEYLPAYKEAVDAGAGLVMTSFQHGKRHSATANRWLNRRILREEWNFDGVLISDTCNLRAPDARSGGDRGGSGRTGNPGRCRYGYGIPHLRRKSGEFSAAGPGGGNAGG